MIEYEVTLTIDSAIVPAYLTWLHEHIEEMLALPGFIDATLHRVIEPAGPADQSSYCVRYRLRDAEALKGYLETFAPAMRAAGIARFGDRFQASRRVLESTSLLQGRDGAVPESPEDEC